jgi:hypothetical protein
MLIHLVAHPVKCYIVLIHAIEDIWEDQTSIKRTHLTKTKWPYRTGDLLKEFDSYEIFYDRARPLNRGDYMGRKLKNKSPLFYKY